MYIEDVITPGVCANCGELKEKHGYNNYPYCPDSLLDNELVKPLTKERWLELEEKE